MTDKEEVVKVELDVKAALDHIKKRFARKLEEGEKVRLCSDDFRNNKHYYFYTESALKKDAVLANGIVVPDREHSMLVLFKDYYELRERDNGVKLITYIIDIDKIPHRCSHHAPMEVYVTNNISRDNIVGWFTYDLSIPDCQIIKTSHDS